MTLLLAPRTRVSVRNTIRDSSLSCLLYVCGAGRGYGTPCRWAWDLRDRGELAILAWHWRWGFFSLFVARVAVRASHIDVVLLY